MERASQHDDPDLKARSDALRRAAGSRVDGRLDPIVRRRSVTRKVLTFLVIALVFGFAIDFANRLDPHAAAAILWLESNSSVKEQVGEIGGHASSRSVTSALKRDAEEWIVNTSSWCEVPKGTRRSWCVPKGMSRVSTSIKYGSEEAGQHRRISRASGKDLRRAHRPAAGSPR